jgi:hypothetical protein
MSTHRYRLHLKRKHNIQFNQEQHGYHKETKQQMLQFVLKDAQDG